MKTDNKRIRIIVAEDHELIRKSLVELIDSDKDCTVISEVDNGNALISEYFNVNPDVIVVNMILDQINGMEALEVIKRQHRLAKALFISNHWDEVLIYHGYRCGGMGYLYTGEYSRKFLNSIKEINDGNYCFPDNLDDIITWYSGKKEFTGYECKNLHRILSNREYEIFLLYGEALTAREIADRLSISKKTVQYHLFNLKEKLNLRNRNQLINISGKYNLLYGKRQSINTKTGGNTG